MPAASQTINSLTAISASLGCRPNILELNGFQIEAGKPRSSWLMENLAKGNLTEQEFATWLREHLATAS